jgi:galactokinase
MASPHFKTGRYSKDLPTRLAARYLEASTDPDLLNLSAEISLVDTRVGELLTGIDSEASARLWGEVGTATEALRKAATSGDTAGMAWALRTLDDLTTTGLEQFTLWADLTTLLEQRRKLVETERRRRVDMQNMITAEQTMLLVSQLVHIIKDNVSDTGTLSRISADISRYILERDSVRVR